MIENQPTQYSRKETWGNVKESETLKKFEIWWKCFAGTRTEMLDSLCRTLEKIFYPVFARTDSNKHQHCRKNRWRTQDTTQGQDVQRLQDLEKLHSDGGLYRLLSLCIRWRNVTMATELTNAGGQHYKVQKRWISTEIKQCQRGDLRGD